MITFNSLPVLPGQDKRPINVVPAEGLTSIGVNTFAFGMNVGDTLSFDKTDSPIVVGQPLREGSDTMVYYVACERNGKPSWITISTFTKRDADNKPCGPIEEAGMKESSFAGVYANVLSGRKITAKSAVVRKFPKFKDNQRTSETIERNVPVLEYAD